ncbi:hypothetical protein SAMN04488020_102137 [Palleronia marisminoris]|uniref:Xylose isomerase-like TIM barrel n=1 Tax=Palleronia marisminoris TaxID=315423 RepID=A0A1Y5RYN2_9RHOB|nr:hypothetical protein [Palleronia marisminoris]SFG40827.1 hypothetical protein SAMN04488020_102137 [Palleronia marisminoris]SLN28655.1 hypothetical protein PAM7066_01143 [Palleronia marisminoris]
MLTIGFSTGALALSDFNHALKLLNETKASAVELSALRAVELPKLLDALQPLLGAIRNQYRYVSFHAPTNFEDEVALVEQLMYVADLGLNIVVHPDTIVSAKAWRRLGSYLCLENLDSRRKTGRTADELEGFFNEVTEAKLCFDIAHARQVDPTMMEAARILERFGSRLAQVHISELNSRGKHFGVSYAAQLAYKPFADVMSRVPIIVESIVEERHIATELLRVGKIFEPLSEQWNSKGSAERGGLRLSLA